MQSKTKRTSRKTRTGSYFKINCLCENKEVSLSLIFKFFEESRTSQTVFAVHQRQRTHSKTSYSQVSIRIEDTYAKNARIRHISKRARRNT